MRQFYGAVNAAKSLPERVKLPTAPKAPDAPSTALGFETPHQRAMKAHAEAMKARATMAPLRQRRHKPANTAPSATPAAAAPRASRSKPH